MTLKIAGKNIIVSEDATYRIGFMNSEGQEDETELDGSNYNELSNLYGDFCKENGFKTNTITYIERV